MSIEIKTLQKQAMREIFKLEVNKEGKLEKEGLKRLFEKINYEMTTVIKLLYFDKYELSN